MHRQSIRRVALVTIAGAVVSLGVTLATPGAALARPKSGACTRYAQYISQDLDFANQAKAAGDNDTYQAWIAQAATDYGTWLDLGC
jgi:hypothetical protein